MSMNPNKCNRCMKAISNSLNDVIKVSLGFFDADYKFNENTKQSMIFVKYFHNKCYMETLK